jgi:hypothetical protein
VQALTGIIEPVQHVPLAHWLSVVQAALGARLHTPFALHCVPPPSLHVAN